MSILLTQPRQEPTKDAMLALQVNNIKSSTANTYQILTNLQKQGISYIWNHLTLSPQEIVDSLGDDAVKIFQYHGKLTTLIEEIAISESLVPDVRYPTNSFTIDSTTGKITISDQPYQKL